MIISIDGSPEGLATVSFKLFEPFNRHEVFTAYNAVAHVDVLVHDINPLNGDIGLLALLGKLDVSSHLITQEQQKGNLELPETTGQFTFVEVSQILGCLLAVAKSTAADTERLLGNRDVQGASSRLNFGRFAKIIFDSTDQPDCLPTIPIYEIEIKSKKIKGFAREET